MKDCTENSPFLVRLRRWLERLTGGDLFARFTAKTGETHRGGGEMRSRRKMLRHEPLEERQLLAVDLTAGLAGGAANFSMPDDESYVQPSEFAPTGFDSALIPCNIAETETQLVESNIIEQESNAFGQTSFDCMAALTSEAVLVTVPRWEDMQGFHTLQPIAPEIDESILESLRRFNEMKLERLHETHQPEADACCAALAQFPTAREHGGISQLEFVDAPVIADEPDDGGVISYSASGQNGSGENDERPTVTLSVSGDSEMLERDGNSASGGFAPSGYMCVVVAASGTSQQRCDIRIQLSGTAGSGEYGVEFEDIVPVFLGDNTYSFDMSGGTSQKIFIYPINDQKPEGDETVILTLLPSIPDPNFIPGSGSDDGTYNGDGSSATVTILDDDHWVIGSSVEDKIAFEEDVADYIRTNGGTGDDKGVFRIFKTPGDENCTDNYPITVEFALSGTATYGAQNDYTVTGATHQLDGTFKTTISTSQPYVDVTINAKSDNIADDNETVILTVTKAYAAGNDPNVQENLFQVKADNDSVVIREAEWSVVSVEWAKHATGNGFENTWTGLSIYADKDDPTITGDDYRKVNVVVTVEGLLPTVAQGGGTVTLVCLDPPNASGTGAANNDGIDIFESGTSNTTTLTFYRDHDDNADGDDNKITQTEPALVGAKAGDNYKIEATDEDDYTVESEILTVWRRLWMELDQMAEPTQTIADGFDPLKRGDGEGEWNLPGSAPTPEPDDFDVFDTPPKPDISLLKLAMQDACVEVLELSSEWNTDQTAIFVHNIDVGDDSSYLDISNSCRDIALNQVSESFWVVHGIGAYEDEETEGYLYGVATLSINGGSFYVFMEDIRDDVSDTEKIAEQWMRTTYHETMHYFGLYDVYDIDKILIDLVQALYDEEGIIADFDSLEFALYLNYDGKIYEFMCHEYPDYGHLLGSYADDPNQGIMNYDTAHFGTWDDIKLKPHQIAQIQSMAKPIPFTGPF